MSPVAFYLLSPLLLAAAAALGEGEHEVVNVFWSFPRRRLTAGNSTTKRHHPDSSVPAELQALFHFNGTDYQLNLRQNRDLLPTSATHTLLEADGTITQGPRPRPCHYLGEVVGLPGSSVGLSSCTGGLIGVVLAFGRVISVEPVKAETGLAVQPLGAAGELEGSQPHIMRQLSDELTLDYITDVSKFVAVPPHEAGRRLTGSSTKYVETFVVNDNSRYLAFGGESGLTELAEHSVSVMNQVTAMYRNAPAGGATFPYTIQVVFVGQQTFKTTDPYASMVTAVGQETGVSSLLNAFNEWGSTQQSAGTTAQYDNRVLLSGLDFDGSTVGLAGLSTMCMQSRSGSVNMCSKTTSATELTNCASVVSHEMGHNFGMHHDSTGNACTQSGLIMEAVGGGTPSEQFSSCSVTYLSNFFTDTYHLNGQCLELPPTRVEGDPICGNGFIEEGEACDCGSSDCTSSDACCNGATCQFADASYQCSGSAGPCCESCMFVAASANKVCRAVANVCDLPEYCPGGTSTCPKNTFNYPGKSCTTNSKAGLCLQGNCESLDATCSVDMHRDFDGNWDLTDTCASYNDDCGTLTCHEKDQSEDYRCAQTFAVHGKQLKVPEGTPCWFPGSAKGTRTGMCHDGVCKLPFQLAVVPLCGNGGIDYGEECDCGSATTDTCCECSTCRLKAGKQCQSSEACCDDQCMFRSAGTECRAATGECDLAETCSGTSSVCPADVGKQWGTACTDDGVPSTCYAKICLDSLDKQCTAKDSSLPFGDFTFSRTVSDFNLCTALSCCQTCQQLSGDYNVGGETVTDPYYCQDCTRSVRTFVFTDAEGNSNTIYLGSPLEGTVLSDTTKYCKLGAVVTPESSCTTGQYLEAAVGKCLSCSSGCTACTGPTSFDCTGDCRYGTRDSRGACPISEDQVNFATPVETTTPATQADTTTLVDTTTLMDTTTMADTTTLAADTATTMADATTTLAAETTTPADTTTMQAVDTTTLADTTTQAPAATTSTLAADTTLAATTLAETTTPAPTTTTPAPISPVQINMQVAGVDYATLQADSTARTNFINAIQTAILETLTNAGVTGITMADLTTVLSAIVRLLGGRSLQSGGVQAETTITSSSAPADQITSTVESETQGLTTAVKTRVEAATQTTVQVSGIEVAIAATTTVGSVNSADRARGILARLVCIVVAGAGFWSVS